MIPTADQLAAVSKLRDGDLREVPFAVLLNAFGVHRRTAVLQIERGPLTKRILLEDGVPVDCTSNLLHETIGRFLVNRGLLTDDQARTCLARSVSAGITFGEAATLDGLLTASELYRALQENLASKLLAVFSWREGRFHVDDEMPNLESPLKIKVAQLVVTGVTKFASPEEVDAAVSDLLGLTLCVHPSPPHPLSVLRLSAAQQELVGQLASGKRLDELAAETRIPFPDIVRLLYSLAILGIVVPREAMPTETGPPSVQVDTRPLNRPRVQVEPDRDVGTVRDELMTAYLRHRKQDAFDLLDVAEDASLREVESAYLAFSQRFAPWRFTEGKLAGLYEKAEDLFLAGGRAFGELYDRERRDELLIRRRNLRARAQRPAAADRFAIQSELLDSELQFRKGKALMEAGRYDEAMEQLAFAHDFDPQNSLYRAELAYCRFQADASRYGEEADRELDETMRIDPKCGLAFYYAGLIKGRLADPAGAERCLRHAIKLLAPDRRPIEALKALAAEGGTGTGKRKLPFLGRSDG